MTERLTHDVLIMGAGLAGLRAALEISRRMEGKADIGILSKVQLMRAHSVCAEGGTAAVLREEEGDSIAPPIDARWRTRWCARAPDRRRAS